MTRDEGERIARLEAEVSHMRQTQEEMNRKVNAMYEAFMQARGAKWVIISLWISIGAILANIKWLLIQLGVKFE